MMAITPEFLYRYIPPLIFPDSGSWIATPNPPSLTGAEFSLHANRTQCGFMSRWMISFSWQYRRASNICRM
jgi:hypothetical protein